MASSQPEEPCVSSVRRNKPGFLHRLRLYESINTPHLPTELAVSADVSFDRWSEFWVQLQPLARRAKQRTKVLFRIHALCFILLLVSAIATPIGRAFWLPSIKPYERTGRIVATLVNYCILHSVVWSLAQWQQRSIHSQLLDLQTAMSENIDLSTFVQHHGLHVEWEYDGVGFAVLITPAPQETNDNAIEVAWEPLIIGPHQPGVYHHCGYLRIRLAAHFYAWTPVSMSHLDKPTLTLPTPAFASLQDWPVWQSIWSELSVAAKRCQRAKTLFYFVSWVQVLSMTQFLVHPSDFIFFIVIVFYATIYNLSRCEARLTQIVDHSRAVFQSHGWRMDLSPVTAYETCAWGLYTVSYLTVAPTSIQTVIRVRSTPA